MSRPIDLFNRELSETVFESIQFKRGMALLERVYKSKGRMNALLFGESGAGKTKLCETFVARHPRYETEEGVVVPVIYATTPSRPTPKNVAESLLFELGPELFGRKTKETLTHQLITLVRNCHTRVIIIDEMQHYVDRWRDRAISELADWLKNLIGATGVSIVLVGMPRITAILRANEQLRRRVNYIHEYAPFSITDEDEQTAFADYLDWLEKASKPYLPLKLNNEEVFIPLFYACNGLIDYLNKICIEASVIAHDRNAKRVATVHLEAAFKSIVWPRCPKDRNPFHRDFDYLPLIRLGEPFAPSETTNHFRKEKE